VDQKRVESLVNQLMIEGLGLDLSDPNLTQTPERIARMLCNELLSSVGVEPIDLTKSFPNDKRYDEIIMFDNIPFTSVCSHHFLLFPGFAWYLYIPDTLLLGASKPARVIDFFSKKPQLQENLATEVVDHLENAVHPKGSMLVMRAVHGCMSCRGVKTGHDAGMTTSITRGCFRDTTATRMEGLDLIKLSLRFK
jgi:GTP cyclohydrolase I